MHNYVEQFFFAMISKCSSKLKNVNIFFFFTKANNKDVKIIKAKLNTGIEIS
jgi:hypothetical protein